MTNGNNPYGGNGGQFTVNFDENGPGADGGQPPGSAPAQAGFVLGDEPSAGQADLIKDTTTAAFQADVIEESRRQTVLVDFWAPWCGPCKQLSPILEKAVREAGGRVKLVKMNIDEHPAIAGQLGVQSIPAVFAFRNGQPVDGFMGALPESQIREFIARVAGEDQKDEIAQAISAAAEVRSGGDVETAAKIYSAVLQKEADNVEALGGLAEILFEAGQVDAAKEVLARVPDGKKEAAPIAAVHAKMSLADQAEQLGDAAELEARLRVDPKDHQARYDLALIQNARGQREEAAENLLAILRADKGWNDDAARTELLKFFEAWGLDDPATLSARRKLSSLLFS